MTNFIYTPEQSEAADVLATAVGREEGIEKAKECVRCLAGELFSKYKDQKAQAVRGVLGQLSLLRDGARCDVVAARKAVQALLPVERAEKQPSPKRVIFRTLDGHVRGHLDVVGEIFCMSSEKEHEWVVDGKVCCSRDLPPLDYRVDGPKQEKNDEQDDS
jgi:hypothetical protein